MTHLTPTPTRASVLLTPSPTPEGCKQFTASRVGVTNLGRGCDTGGTDNPLKSLHKSQLSRCTTKNTIVSLYARARMRGTKNTGTLVQIYILYIDQWLSRTKSVTKAYQPCDTWRDGSAKVADFCGKPLLFGGVYS